MQAKVTLALVWVLIASIVCASNNRGVAAKIHVHTLVRQFVKWSFTATAAAAGITVGFVSDNIALADTASSQRRVDDYLVREIDYSRQQKKLSISQGFGVLRNRPPAQGGGDRTGAYLWSGGIELGATILDKQVFDVTGKRVVDLGTGTGIVGMTCILAGAGEVVMTDGATEILGIAAKNVRDNFDIQVVEDPSSSLSGTVKGVHVSVTRLRWDDKEDIQKVLSVHPPSYVGDVSSDKESERYDFVIASEVAYERKSIAKLLNTMKMLVKPSSGVAILRLTPELTDEARGFDSFTPELRSFGFTVLEYPDQGDSNSQLFKLALR